MQFFFCFTCACNKSHVNFIVITFSENPRSLQDSCRFVIREALGAKRLKDIAKLPVSSIMKEFLLYKYD